MQTVGIEKRGKWWGVYFGLPGDADRKAVRQTLPFPATQEERARLKRNVLPEIRRELAAQDWKALHKRFPDNEKLRARLAGGDISMKQLFDAMDQNWENTGCRSIKDMRYKLKEAREFAGFKDRYACDVTARTILEFVEHLQARGVSHATINRKLAQVKRAFNFALEKQVIQSMSVFPDEFAEPVARQTRYTEDEVDRMLTKLPEHLQGGVETASITGWRLSEIFSRKKSDIIPDGQGGFFLYLDELHSKNKEQRYFPVTPRLRAVLDRQLAFVRKFELEHGLVTPYLFPNGDPRHKLGDRVLRFDKSLKTACDEAGLNIDPDTGTQRVHPETGKPMNRWFHDFRRYASDYLEDLGLSDSDIMALIGHKTLAMRLRYKGQISGDKVRKVGARLAAAEAAPRHRSNVVSLREATTGNAIQRPTSESASAQSVPQVYQSGSQGDEPFPGESKSPMNSRGFGWAGSESNTRHKDFQP